jgi:acyl-CoA thioester hydrolase
MARDEFWFRHPRCIEYAQIDAQGVVFNSHYLTFFDTAIYEYLRAVGFDLKAHVRERGEDFHTVRAEVDFISPIEYGEEIEVCARVARTGRSSLHFALEIYRENAADPAARGRVVWVNTHQAHRRSVPLPTDLTERIQSRETGPRDPGGPAPTSG